MLRITQSSSAGAAIKYYTEGLSKADYYVGKDSPSAWGGLAAEWLGLSGEVDAEDFRKLVFNENPATGDKLNPRWSEKRRVGYDFTFNSTKSVSMALEFSKDESVKQDIMEAWNKAIELTMKEAEQGMLTREHRGLHTFDVTTGNMVWASFTHDRSRPVNGIPSPHLHQHVYVFNTTWNDRKERFQAGQFGQIKKDAPYYEAVFHNHMAKGLMDKGFAIERKNGKAELKGISREGIETFSERTRQIEQYVQEKGIQNAELKGQVGAKLRKGKSEQLPEAEVQAAWEERLSDADREAIDNLRNDDDDKTPPVGSGVALAHALEHELQNYSTVNEKRLLATALKHGVGSVTVEQLRDQYSKQGVLIGKNHRTKEVYVTTKTVLREENDMIAFAAEGREACFPMTQKKHDVPAFFNRDQRRAAKHIWSSRNKVAIVQGKAGTGKTTLMQTVVRGIEEEGKEVVALAPTSSAASMLGKEGFEQNSTLARFLLDKQLQQQSEGKVIWLDEAGMVGTRDMRQLFRIAEQGNMRVVLTGDTTQHHSVGRGDAMRLLIERAKLHVAEVGEIQRQRTKLYKNTIGWLSQKNIKGAFKGFDLMGAIKEIKPEKDEDGNIIPSNTLHKALAKDYVNTVNKGRSALVVSPTHLEKDKVTTEIRNQLKESGKIQGEERTIKRHKVLHFSTAEKKDIRNYAVGQQIELNQNIRGGFVKGEQLTVLGVENHHLQVQRANGETGYIHTQAASRFDLIETGQVKLAVGDIIRITKGGQSKHEGRGKARFNNGSRYQIAGFTKDGDITLKNGRIISKDYGHIDHGFVTTSHSSQGATVDKVIIANSSDSFGAATNLEQFYVSASRGRHNISIYTDDKKELLEQASKTSERLAATELMEKRHGFWNNASIKATEHLRRVKFITERYAANFKAEQERNNLSYGR